jgi:hypothetical protein
MFTPNQIKGDILTRTGDIFASVTLNSYPATHLRQTQYPFTGKLMVGSEDGITQTYDMKGSYAVSSLSFIAFWVVDEPSNAELTPSNTAFATTLYQGWFYGEFNIQEQTMNNRNNPTLTSQSHNSPCATVKDSDVVDSSVIRRIHGQWGTQTNPSPTGIFQGKLVLHTIKGTLTLNQENTAKIMITLEPKATLTIEPLPFTGTIQYIESERATQSIKLMGTYCFNGNTMIVFWKTPIVPTTNAASVVNSYLGQQGWFFGEVSSL